MDYPSMFSPDKVVECLLTCPQGVENLLSKELLQVKGIITKEGQGHIEGRVSLLGLYKLCLHSRIANRVILLISKNARIETDDALFKEISQLPWSDHLATETTFKIDFHGRSAWLRHTTFGAQRVKDAIQTFFQENRLPCPSVELKHPQLRIYASLHHQRLLIGIDFSGESLHQRGYRQQSGAAPLKENLAAALLLRAGWPHDFQNERMLVDPLCGSGTLLIEAAQIALGIAPNAQRRFFGFHFWRGFDLKLWEQVIADYHAQKPETNLNLSLYGYDADPKMIVATRENAERAGVAEFLKLNCQKIDQLSAPQAVRGLLITNPPYGERLGDKNVLNHLYQELNQKIKEYFAGWRIALFAANEVFDQNFSLQAYRRYQLYNGALPCQLRLYEIYTPKKVSPPRNEQHPDQEKNPETSVSEPDNIVMFVNRLRKNLRRLQSWHQALSIDCYRIYDADLPEYAVAIDRYADYFVVQEYAAPASIAPAIAEQRFQAILANLPNALNVATDHLFIKRRHKQQRYAQYQKLQHTQHRLVVQEGQAKFWVNLRDYIDTGLYLDHRFVRRELFKQAKNKRLLNLYCYTATATVQAALGGSISSVSVDASNTYIQWALDNLKLNHLPLHAHQLVKSDVRQWLDEAKVPCFDLMYIDPPTFSNSKSSRADFDVQRDHCALLKSAFHRLNAQGIIYFSTHRQRFKLDDALQSLFEITNISTRSKDLDFQRRPSIHHLFILRKR